MLVMWPNTVAFKTNQKGERYYMSYIPGIIESYEKLFVIISMKKEFITPDDLINSLMIQIKEQAKNGEQRFFREIFLDQNIMSVK